MILLIHFYSYIPPLKAEYILTLINHFVSHLGITPYSYYKNLRINYAKKLINHGSTFEEAAESTGYSEAAALIRAMKQK